MSAAIFLRQRDAAYLLSDAAVYYADGVIAEFVDKCTMIPQAHCALTMLGPGSWQPIMADAIGESFDSYDAVKAGIEPLARRMFGQYVDAIRWKMKTAELWVVGWSQALGAPEAFTLAMCSDEEWQTWIEREPDMSRAPFVPDVQRVAINANPAPSADEIYAAKFPACDPEQYVPELDLLHFMEIQRRTPLEHQDWPWLVGGYALLTTIDAAGVTQRRIHEWPEDRVGEKITPAPMNWLRWRAEREAGKPLSRLKVEMLERREAKARRRLAG